MVWDPRDNQRPSGGGGLMGIGGIWGGICGAPVAPGGRGGMDIPPGGGGGMSLPGCPSTALIRGGGRFIPVGTSGPPTGGRSFSILKWNCRKNCKDEQQRSTTYFLLKMLDCLCCTKITCLVSLFQWVQKRVSALSISLLGTWGKIKKTPQSL